MEKVQSVPSLIIASTVHSLYQVPYFRDGDGSAALGRVLLAFARLAPRPGYVQGMSTLASMILLVFTGGGSARALITDPRNDDADGHLSDDGSNGMIEGAARGSAAVSLAPTPPPTDPVDEEAAFWTFAALVLGRLGGYFDEGLPALMLDSKLLEALVRDGDPTDSGAQASTTTTTTSSGAGIAEATLPIRPRLVLPAGLSTSLSGGETSDKGGFEWLLLTPDWFLQVRRARHRCGATAAGPPPRVSDEVPSEALTLAPLPCPFLTLDVQRRAPAFCGAAPLGHGHGPAVGHFRGGPRRGPRGCRAGTLVAAFRQHRYRLRRREGCGCGCSGGCPDPRRGGD